MSVWRHALVGMAAALAASMPPMPASADDGGLAPYKMMRSLQLVQDRIANGDHAAVPMQSRLLEMTDERLRAAEADDFEDRRNVDAMLAAAMSGGNPTTLEATLSRHDFDEATRAVGNALVHYLNGDVGRARAGFAGLDHEAYGEQIRPFLLLINAAIISQPSPAAALDMLDRARLLAPGSLVEEAALRRSIALAAELQNLDRFILASAQYSRRFLRSPYAVEYAENMVEGIVRFASAITEQQIADIVQPMNREQARTVYLRLARKSAIEGHQGLLELASAQAAALESDAIDPRSQLYANISDVTSQQVGDVMKRLETLDEDALNQRDRRLLHAARAVAAGVLSPAAGGPAEAPPVPETPEPAVQTDEGDGQADAFLASTRSKLDEIDALLERAQR